MPKNSGPTNRDMFPTTDAGKGDADRSPGWRAGYDEINWGVTPPARPIQDFLAGAEIPADCFVRVRPGVQKKIYR